LNIIPIETWTAFQWGLPKRVSDKKLGVTLELPEGYEFRTVPRDSRIVDSENSNIKVQPSYNYAQMVVAVVQLLYALSSLYRARTHQIERFGYAAFGLTVTPYAVMSLVNLMSFLFCPDFKELYLVHSSILEEVMTRKGLSVEKISVVGKLDENNELPHVPKSKGELVRVDFDAEKRTATAHILAANMSPSSPKDDANSRGESPSRRSATSTSDTSQSEFPYAIWEPEDETSTPPKDGPKLYICSNFPHMTTDHPVLRLWYWIFPTAPRKKKARPTLGATERVFKWDAPDIVNLLLVMIVCGAIVGIVGGISRFQRNQSSLSQRVWTMLWLATGLSSSFISHGVHYISMKARKAEWAQYLSWMVAIPLIAPAIGGFVIVGQMIGVYGTCTKISA
jgi:uncharacterized integral membrane protein